MGAVRADVNPAAKNPNCIKTGAAEPYNGAKASPKSAALASEFPCIEAAAIIIHRETTPPKPTATKVSR